VVVELKTGAFEPEFTGNLGFYFAAIDNQMKHPSDNKTIGILLCKSKDNVVAEYASQVMNAPDGVAQYTLSHDLPEEFKKTLPSLEKLEDELSQLQDI
jgi:hypothetical protein